MLQTLRKASPSRRNKLPSLAWQSRIAFASMVSNTGLRSPSELAMTRSTSEVAACCSRASESSCVSRAVFFFSESVPRGRRVRRGAAADPPPHRRAAGDARAAAVPVPDGTPPSTEPGVHRAEGGEGAPDAGRVRHPPQRRDQPLEFDRLGVELVASGGERLFAG